MANVSGILDGVKAKSLQGSVCPYTVTPAPAPDYMRSAFPSEEQEAWCNGPTSDAAIGQVNDGVDRELGIWPRWAPKEAMEAATKAQAEREAEREAEAEAEREAEEETTARQGPRAPPHEEKAHRARKPLLSWESLTPSR